MSKKDFLRKLLSEGRSADDIADLFGITVERMEKYLEDPSQSRLAVAEIKTELRRLESLPLETKEDILLFSFKVD
jgi:predicted transcriptional regulator